MTGQPDPLIVERIAPYLLQRGGWPTAWDTRLHTLIADLDQAARPGAWCFTHIGVEWGHATIHVAVEVPSPDSVRDEVWRLVQACMADLRTT